MLQPTHSFALQTVLLQLGGPLKIYVCSHDLRSCVFVLKNRITNFVDIRLFSFLCVLLLAEKKKLKIMLTVQDFDHGRLAKILF